MDTGSIIKEEFIRLFRGAYGPFHTSSTHFDPRIFTNKDGIIMSFGDGSFLSINPSKIYPSKEKDIDVMNIEGECMFQASVPSSWCGFPNLKIKIVSYGPPKREPEKPPTSWTNLKNFFGSDPEILCPSNLRFGIPEFWSELPVLKVYSWGKKTDSSRHKSVLENTYWPIEDFEKIKAMKLDRKIVV